MAVCTDLLIEFLEVTFNNILYSRKLYPGESFIEKKMYSTRSYVCQHPEVNKYMENVLKAIRVLIVTDPSSVVTVTFNIFNNDKQLAEKYVFNIQSVQDDSLLEKDPYFLKFEDHLRTVCQKLLMATSYLESLPYDSTFTIDAEVSQWIYIASGNENSMCQKFPWTLVNRDSIDDYVTTLIPLTCIKSKHIAVELFVLKNKPESDYLL